jgi:hypothetical protein
MSAIQLSFSLRATSKVKTVHLIGSWDGYQGQLPLSKDSSKSGAWKGTFRFQTKVLQPGQRYWFYYMLDGYQVSHDPSKEHTTEPTTGRKLNILDVPAGKSSSASRRSSRAVPQGRSVSPSNIKCPKPQRPGQTAHLVQGEYTQATLAALNARFAQASIDSDDDSEIDEDSDDDSECSDVPSLTSASSRSDTSSPSSVASACSCERYGITRAGNRVKLDCGGSRCGDSEDSECESDSDAEQYKHHIRSTRRHGVVIGA